MYRGLAGGRRGTPNRSGRAPSHGGNGPARWCGFALLTFGKRLLERCRVGGWGGSDRLDTVRWLLTDPASTRHRPTLGPAPDSESQLPADPDGAAHRLPLDTGEWDMPGFRCATTVPIAPCGAGRVSTRSSDEVRAAEHPAELIRTAPVGGSREGVAPPVRGGGSGPPTPPEMRGRARTFTGAGCSGPNVPLGPRLPASFAPAANPHHGLLCSPRVSGATPAPFNSLQEDMCSAGDGTPGSRR